MGGGRRRTKFRLETERDSSVDGAVTPVFGVSTGIVSAPGKEVGRNLVADVVVVQWILVKVAMLSPLPPKWLLSQVANRRS